MLECQKIKKGGLDKYDPEHVELEMQQFDNTRLERDAQAPILGRDYSAPKRQPTQTPTLKLLASPLIAITIIYFITLICVDRSTVKIVNF